MWEVLLKVHGREHRAWCPSKDQMNSCLVALAELDNVGNIEEEEEDQNETSLDADVTLTGATRDLLEQGEAVVCGTGMYPDESAVAVVH